MRHLHKRIVSAALALCMLAGMLPAHAEEYEIIDEEADASLFQEEFQPLEEAEETAEQGTEEEILSEEVLSEEILSEAAGYPWETMSDDAFASFIQDGGYAAYAEDQDAIESLFARLELVEDTALAESLADILIAWLESMLEPDSFIMALDLGTYSGMLTLDDINTPDMFFRQEDRGTCTLASSAMLVRRAARMNGYWDWESITESAMRPYIWIEGVGLPWNFSYAGITVAHGFFSSDFPANLQTMQNMLAAHPEGFIAYNSHVPHSVLITDYSNGVLYCADPGYTGARGPVATSYLGTGDQDTTIAGFTAYWYVSSPKLSLGQTITPIEPDSEIQLEAQANEDFSVTLTWNDVGAVGYYIYRSYYEKGPWVEVLKEVYDVTTWTDTGVEPLKHVYYRIQPFNSSHSGTSYSNVAEAVTDTADRISDGTCGGSANWVLYQDGRLVIMGSGIMSDFAAEDEEPWSEYRDSITSVEIADGITGIGRSAFGGCTALTSVSIPASVASIGDWAFRGCSSLSGVELPYGLRSIGYAAFRQCAALSAMDIPNTVTSIGDWAFSECNALARVKLPAYLNAIGVAMFYEDNALTTVELPESLQSIGDHAFRGCRGLRNLSFPASLKSVGQYAFAMCHSMTYLSLESSGGTLRLDEGAFYNCTGLTEVYLPSCEMGYYAFAYCYALRNVFLNQYYYRSTVRGYAFYGCGNLKWIQILGGLVDSDAYTFRGVHAVVLVGSGSFGDYTVDLERPEGDCILRTFRDAGTIGNGLWYLDAQGVLNIHCNGAIPGFDSRRAPWYNDRNEIKTIYLDNGVTSIGNYVFANLYNVKTVQMPAKAVSVADYSFAGVTADVIFHDVDGSWSQVSGKDYGGHLSWQDQHVNVWTLTREPSFAEEGTLTAVCSICGRDQQIALPALNTVDYTFREEDGTAIYTWKNTECGTYSFSAALVRIDAQPKSVSIGAGEPVSFSVTASGSDLHFQWQQMAVEGDQWGDYTAQGAQTAELQLTVQKEMNGWQFRCRITDATGTTVYSEAAVLTVGSGFEIMEQPVSATVEQNKPVSFHVTVAGEGLRYQWQWKASASAADWTDCTASTQGHDTDTIYPEATLVRNGYQYRCVITDASGEVLISHTATLTVDPGAVTIILQPTSVAAFAGEDVSFFLIATGAGLRYQWQTRANDGENWTNCSFLTIGYDQAELVPKADATHNGYQYRCIIRDSKGESAISEVVTLNVSSGLTILSQPSSQMVASDSTANFHLTATGTGLRYQWQVRPSGVSGWRGISSQVEGYNTDSLKPTADASMDGYKYRCVVYDSYGACVFSNVVTLTVY